MSNDRFPGSGPILPISHTQPPGVSQEGIVSGSTGRHPPTEEPGLLLSVVVLLLLLANQTIQLLTTRPGRTGTARQWEPGKANPSSQWAKSHKPQCLPFSTPPPPGLGLSARKARGRGGDPKSSPGQATPWHRWVARAGWTVSVSHEASLFPCAWTAPWAPHVGVGKGWRLVDHPASGHLLSSLRPPPAPVGDENLCPQEVIPKPQWGRSQEPAKPVPWLRCREVQN